MVEHGSLGSLVVTSDLIKEIKEAQWKDPGMIKIRARMSEDKMNVSNLMMKESYGLENGWWFPKILSLERKFLMKLMNLNSPSILEATKSIKI